MPPAKTNIRLSTEIRDLLPEGVSANRSGSHLPMKRILKFGPPVARQPILPAQERRK
jgi:hypothetical protein